MTLILSETYHIYTKNELHPSNNLVLRWLFEFDSRDWLNHNVTSPAGKRRTMAQISNPRRFGHPTNSIGQFLAHKDRWKLGWHSTVWVTFQRQNWVLHPCRKKLTKRFFSKNKRLKLLSNSILLAKGNNKRQRTAENLVNKLKTERNDTFRQRAFNSCLWWLNDRTRCWTIDLMVFFSREK